MYDQSTSMYVQSQDQMLNHMHFQMLFSLEMFPHKLQNLYGFLSQALHHWATVLPRSYVESFVFSII